MVDRLHEPPIPENPYPEASPAGRAWFKGLNAGTAYEAPRIVNMALNHADELTRLRARVAELEAQVAALSAEPTEDEKYDSAELAWSEMYGIRRLNMEECAKDLEDIMGAALTAFLRRRSQP